jgi:hypothetical protein
MGDATASAFIPLPRATPGSAYPWFGLPWLGLPLDRPPLG